VTVGIAATWYLAREATIKISPKTPRTLKFIVTLDFRNSIAKDLPECPIEA